MYIDLLCCILQANKAERDKDRLRSFVSDCQDGMQHTLQAADALQLSSRKLVDSCPESPKGLANAMKLTQSDMCGRLHNISGVLETCLDT